MSFSHVGCKVAGHMRNSMECPYRDICDNERIPLHSGSLAKTSSGPHWSEIRDVEKGLSDNGREEKRRREKGREDE